MFDGKRNLDYKKALNIEHFKKHRFVKQQHITVIGSGVSVEFKFMGNRSFIICKKIL